MKYSHNMKKVELSYREYKIQNNGIWWKDIQRTKEKAKTYTCAGTGTDKVFNIKVSTRN